MADNNNPLDLAIGDKVVLTGVAWPDRLRGCAYEIVKWSAAGVPAFYDETGRLWIVGGPGTLWEVKRVPDSVSPGASPDMVNHPPHYTSDPSGVECITITRHRNFNIGNAIKYLWRSGLKDDPAQSALDKQIEDLEKSVFYITDEINRLKELRK